MFILNSTVIFIETYFYLDSHYLEYLSKSTCRPFRFSYTSTAGQYYLFELSRTPNSILTPLLIVLFIFLQIILEHEQFTHKNDIFVRHNIFMDVMVALYPQTPGSVISSYCISTIIVHKLYQYTIKRVLIALAILHQFSSGAVKTFLVNK